MCKLQNNNLIINLYLLTVLYCIDTFKVDVCTFTDVHDVSDFRAHRPSQITEFKCSGTITNRNGIYNN